MRDKVSSAVGQLPPDAEPPLVAKADADSERQLHLHHRWAQATTLTQIAISLAAITLLTRRRWLLGAALGVAGLGAIVGAVAFLGY